MITFCVIEPCDAEYEATLARITKRYPDSLIVRYQSTIDAMRDISDADVILMGRDIIDGLPNDTKEAVIV